MCNNLARSYPTRCDAIALTLARPNPRKTRESANLTAPQTWGKNVVRCLEVVPLITQCRSVSNSLSMRSGNPAQVIVQLSQHTATALTAIGVTQGDPHLLLQMSTSIPFYERHSEIEMLLYLCFVEICHEFAAHRAQTFSVHEVLNVVCSQPLAFILPIGESRRLPTSTDR